jgi:ABC-type sugar transport system substrate-binding protein
VRWSAISAPPADRRLRAVGGSLGSRRPCHPNVSRRCRKRADFRFNCIERLHPAQSGARASLRSYLREHAPDYRLLEPVVDQEQPAVAYDAALTLLRRHPELVGIYSAGAGTDGIVEALVEEGRGTDVVLVCNELTPNVRSALIDRVVDLVIATPTTSLAERTVRAILDAIERPSTFAPVQIMLPFQIYGPENI